MTDTLFADISQFNSPLTAAYPLRGIAIRTNDGTIRDSHWAANWAAAKQLQAEGRIQFAIAYTVYETNWQQSADIHAEMVAGAPWWLASMLDVESWGGRISGNQSGGINSMRALIAANLYRGNQARVIGYGNVGDLNGLWPSKNGCKLIVANYSYNPVYPDKIAHQFSDNYPCPPFGTCDMNSADGYMVAQFMAQLGIVAPAPPKPTPAPDPVPKPTPVPPTPTPTLPKEPDMIMVHPDPSKWPAGTPWPGEHMLDANTVKHIAAPSDIAAYKSAGVPGPVTITVEEFNSYPKVGT